jgi:hypothetical protein
LEVSGLSSYSVIPRESTRILSASEALWVVVTFGLLVFATASAASAPTARADAMMASSQIERFPAPAGRFVERDIGLLFESYTLPL